MIYLSAWFWPLCCYSGSPRVVKSLTNYCEEKIRGEDQMVIFIHNIQTEGETPGSILGFRNITFYVRSVMLLWFNILNYLQTLQHFTCLNNILRGEWANQIYWTLFPFKLPQRKIVLFYVSGELVQLKETEQNSGWVGAKNLSRKIPASTYPLSNIWKVHRYLEGLNVYLYCLRKCNHKTSDKSFLSF